jgi:hypothetical protein
VSEVGLVQLVESSHKNVKAILERRDHSRKDGGQSRSDGGHSKTCQEEMKAGLEENKATVKAIQENMESMINFIWTELEER